MQAKNPVRNDLVKELGVQHLNLTCGAVCVYPNRVAEARKCLKECGGLQIPIASGDQCYNLSHSHDLRHTGSLRLRRVMLLC